MNISLEKSTPVNGKLVITLVEADYKPQVDKVLKDYRKRANIKGFRPGMVPEGMIKKMYGKPALIEEVNTVLSKAVQSYIKDNNLKIVGDPMPTRDESIDFDTQTEFTFTYELGFAGDFSIDFDALPAVTSYEIQATDKEVEEAVSGLQKQFGEQIHAEIVEEGDMIFGTFTQGEWSEKSAIPFKAIKEEAKATFVGAAKDATLTFDVDAVFTDEKSKELATGRKGETPIEGEVSFVIEDITRQGTAEIDQAFFDKVLGEGKSTNEAEFRAEVKDIIQANYVRESEYLMRLDAEKLLLDNVKIDLPEDFLKNWLVAVNEGKFTLEQIEADFDSVRRDISMNLIKNEIADKNEIKVDYPEVLEKAKDMVRSQFGMYGNAADPQMEEMIEKIAQGYLTEKNSQDNFMKLFNQVYADKVATVVLSKVKKEVKSIDFEGFKAIAQGQA